MTKTQAQTLKTALQDLSVAEDALVSQTELVRSQAQRIGELESGLREISEGRIGPEAHHHYSALRRAVKIATALLQPQHKESLSMIADLRAGMRLFQAWFVSGEDAWGPLHQDFKDWGDAASRETVRDLFSLAHGEEMAR